MLIFLAMATAVFGRLVQIQVIQGKSLALAAAASHTTSITLHATRGVILDREGRVLVSNVQVFDVFARSCADRRDRTARRSPACSRRFCR